MKGQIGNATTTMTIMDFAVDLNDIHGNKYDRVILQDVQVNPKFNYNLFSIIKLLKDGFHLKGNSTSLYVAQYKDRKQIHFDVKVLTNTSFLFGAYMCRI